MTDTRAKARWRKDRYGHVNLRHRGYTIAFIFQHGDAREWFGHSVGTCLSANVLREIARKVDVLNAKGSK